MVDNVVVVVGGAQGMRGAIVGGLAAEGSHVVVADVALRKAETTVRELSGHAMAVGADVRGSASIDAMACFGSGTGPTLKWAQ